MKDGKLDDAVVEFRNAISFDPGYAEAHSELAKALEKQGKSVEAAAERAGAQSRWRTLRPIRKMTEKVRAACAKL